MGGELININFFKKSTKSLYFSRRLTGVGSDGGFVLLAGLTWMAKT